MPAWKMPIPAPLPWLIRAAFSASSPRAPSSTRYSAALDRFDALAGSTQGMVVMGGDQGQPRSPFPAISWRELGDALKSSLGTRQSP